MKFYQLIILLFCIGILSCGPSKPKATIEEMNRLSEFVEQKEIKIESDWAMPLTTNSLVSLQNAGFFPPGSNTSRINLIGNPNYFKIIGDSISAELPYYGEVQMSAGHYGGDTGININNSIQDYNVEKNDKKGLYKITFQVQGETEGYRVFLTLFPNGRSSLRLNGNNRFPIEYTGNYSQIESKPNE